MLVEYAAAAELVESVDEWVVKAAEDRVMEAVEMETDRDQAAWGQDRGPDPAYDHIAP